jgi:hypothetical protein
MKRITKILHDWFWRFRPRKALPLIMIGVTGLAGCRATSPEREDLEDAIMKGLTVTTAQKVERAVVTKYKCRVFSYGLVGYGQYTRCYVTYILVFKPDVPVTEPTEFQHMLIMARHSDGWEALANEASQNPETHSR